MSFGIAVAGLAAKRTWYRTVVGGAAGGLLIGAVVKLLGHRCLQSADRTAPADITGAAGRRGARRRGRAGAWLAGPRNAPRRCGAAPAIAALAGGAAGSGDHAARRAADGRQPRPARAQLSRTRACGSIRSARLFGEDGFGPVGQVVTGGLEGALFARLRGRGDDRRAADHRIAASAAPSAVRPPARTRVFPDGRAAFPTGISLREGRTPMAWNTKGILAGVLLVAAAPLLAQATEDNWEGLVRVKSDKIELVYLAPEADFRPYTKVMLDPSEMAMEKNWLRDQRREQQRAGRPGDRARHRPGARRAARSSSTSTSPRRSPRPASPSPPLRAPTWCASRRACSTSTWSRRTSRSGTDPHLFGRGGGRHAGDRSAGFGDQCPARPGDRAAHRRRQRPVGAQSRASNRADFDRLFRRWAETSAEGLAELKALSPVDVNGARLAR